MRARVELSIEQFNVIFQVIKEFDNVTWEQTPDLGSQESIDQALGTARGVNRAARTSGASQVVFSDPEAPGEQHEEAPPTVEQAGGTTVIHASAATGHLALWPPIASFVAQSLGDREIYLRAGYTSAEISSAVAHLSAKLEQQDESFQ